MNIKKWKETLEMERKGKDAFFGGDQASPISVEDKAGFEGLDYYPIDSSYRFELELDEHSKKQTIILAYTRGEKKVSIRWGEFRFKVQGQAQSLQAYKSDPLEERLFVPFRDLTNGKETYGAGRYIDLVDEIHKTPDGKWILDFNKAYNPWCAYSEKYTCPLIPPENWLKVDIRAGEKKYHPTFREE